MRRDKVITRILLILSVVHAAASAPAIIRQRSGTVRDNTPPAPGDPELHSDPSPELGTPHLNIDQPPTSGTPELQNHPPPVPGSPQVHDVFGPPAPGSYEEYVSQYRSWHNSGSVGPPPAFGSSLRQTIQQYEKAPSSHADSSVQDYVNRYLNWHFSGKIGPAPTGSGNPRPLYQEAPPSHAPQPLEPEAPPLAPKTHTVYKDALKQGLAGVRDGAIVGAAVGASVGLTYGAVKLIVDHSQNKSRPAGRDLASGGVVIRGESMHPLPPKRPVSRANDKLRSEDLRLLSILTRRALERLD